MYDQERGSDGAVTGALEEERGLEPKLRVLALHSAIMGHAAYADRLEDAFRSSRSVTYDCVRMTEAVRRDFALRLARRVVMPSGCRQLSRLRGDTVASVSARRELRSRLIAAKDGPPEVLHVHTQALAYFLPPPGASAWGCIVPPTVVSIDRTVALLAIQSGGWSAELRTLARLEAQALRRCSHVVGWSDWASRSALEEYQLDPSRVSTIPAPVPIPALPARAEFQEGTIRALFVGNDFSRKGGPDLIAAFNNHVSCGFELDVVCSDPGLPMPTGDRRFRVHGQLLPGSPQLRDLYARADVFVFPTRVDASPSVILEAMSHGLPIVTTDVGAIAEMIRGDGHAGLIVPIGAPTALGQAIDRLAFSPEQRAALGGNARARAIALSSPERIAGRWIQLFGELTAKSGIGT